MVMTRLAIPLAIPLPGAIRAGSGFFARYAEIEWLMTAGHLPLMLAQPHSRWPEWPSLMTADVAGIRRPFSLFVDAAHSQPRFAYIGGGDEPIGDFLALPVPNGTAAACDAALLSIDAPPPLIGSAGIVIGYPTAISPWPASQAQEFPVKIGQTTPEITEYSPAAPSGTSGGPLIGPSGQLLGMTIGYDACGKAVTVFAIREILKANLAARDFEA
jgi:hypothetical protein